jgi:hypothetical protein
MVPQDTELIGDIWSTLAPCLRSQHTNEHVFGISVLIRLRKFPC